MKSNRQPNATMPAKPCPEEQELEEPSHKEMQSNQRFKFPSMPEQVLSKGKHISSSSPTADISIMTDSAAPHAQSCFQ